MHDKNSYLRIIDLEYEMHEVHTNKCNKLDILTKLRFHISIKWLQFGNKPIFMIISSILGLQHIFKFNFTTIKVLRLWKIELTCMLYYLKKDINILKHLTIFIIEVL